MFEFDPLNRDKDLYKLVAGFLVFCGAAAGVATQSMKIFLIMGIVIPFFIFLHSALTTYFLEKTAAYTQKEKDIDSGFFLLTGHSLPMYGASMASGCICVVVFIAGMLLYLRIMGS